MERKSQKIYVVVAAAEKYLGIWDLTDELQGVLWCYVPSSQAIGMVKEQMGSK